MQPVWRTSTKILEGIWTEGLVSHTMGRKNFVLENLLTSPESGIQLHQSVVLENVIFSLSLPFNPGQDALESSSLLLEILDLNSWLWLLEVLTWMYLK